MLLSFKVQEFFSRATEKNLLPVLFGLTNFLPKVIYANIIEALNLFYKKLAYWLNDKGKDTVDLKV